MRWLCDRVLVGQESTAEPERAVEDGEERERERETGFESGLVPRACTLP